MTLQCISIYSQFFHYILLPIIINVGKTFRNTGKTVDACHIAKNFKKVNWKDEVNK